MNLKYLFLKLDKTFARSHINYKKKQLDVYSGAEKAWRRNSKQFLCLKTALTIIRMTN